MPRKNSIKTLYVDKNSSTGLSYYDSNDDILNLYREEPKNMKRSSTSETLVDKDSRNTLFKPQSVADFLKAIKKKSDIKKKYTCSDLEKLIDDYVNITGNEVKRKEIYDKIVNAWSDIEKDVNCLNNKKNIPKALTDFFGTTKESTRSLKRTPTFSLKKSGTIKKSTTSEPGILKSKFGSISRKFTK